MYLKQNLYTNQAIQKVREDVVHRFRDLEAGFTRVESTGRRRHDKAQTALIEFTENPIMEYEKEQEKKLIEDRQIHTFWEWEHKILKQEKEFYMKELRQLKEAEDEAVQEVCKALDRDH